MTAGTHTNLHDTVVLPGAGISIEGPSSLPSGDELSLKLFDMVSFDASRWYSAGALAEVRREIRAGQIRLEVICDLMSADLPSRDVLRIFRLLRSAAPNRLHYALAVVRPHAILTPNQDVLLERAADRAGSDLTLVHLHGRADRPRTILTTATDYVHGLPAHQVSAFIEAVRGRDVVVIGYSGRDRDIMDVFMSSEPRSVLWVEHGRRSKDSELPPELQTVEAHFDAIWTRIGAPTGDWLIDQIERTQRDRVYELLGSAPHSRRRAARVENEVAAAFASLDAIGRALAIGRVLRHAGFPEDARAGFAKLRRARPKSARAQFAWAEATFELDEFAAAIPVFRKISQNGATAQLRAESMLGEVESLRNMSRHAEAQAVLARLPAAIEQLPRGAIRSRLAAAVACQSAGVARTDGDLAAADAAYMRAEQESVKAGDVRNALEARIWMTEISLARGRYAEALQASVNTLEYAPLVNARWLTWAKFVHIEALGAAGKQSDALATAAQTLVEFKRYGNAMGEAWTLLAEAMFMRATDAIGAKYSVEAAGDAILRYGERLMYAEARQLWETAEVSRALGNLTAARRALDRYMRHVRRFARVHPWLEVHGAALSAELLRESGKPGAAATRARATADAYHRLQAEGASRRMEISVWLSSARRTPADTPPPSFSDWATKGFALELSALDAWRMSGYAPLQLWFVP